MTELGLQMRWSYPVGFPMHLPRLWRGCLSSWDPDVVLSLSVAEKKKKTQKRKRETFILKEPKLFVNTSLLLGEIIVMLCILLHGFQLGNSTCHFWHTNIFFLAFMSIERLTCLFYRVRD